MKKSVFLILLLMIVLGAAFGNAAACDEFCTTNDECTDAACHCCLQYGEITTCQSCVPPVPEFPTYGVIVAVLVIGLVILGWFLISRKKK